MCEKYPASTAKAAREDSGRGDKLRILMVVAELAPLVAVGGVAEYVLGLASALLRAGHDVRVLLPAYAFLKTAPGIKTVNTRMVVPLGIGATQVTSVEEVSVECPGDDGHTLTVILAGNHPHFASVRSAADIYAWPNHEPWIGFARTAMEVATALEWQPDVVHCHDAQAALTPVYISQLRQQQPESVAPAIRTLLTIHNLLNQGCGDRGLLAYAGLPDELFDVDCFEFYGQANCLKAGLTRADRVNTVSKTYAEEIRRSDEYGFGLHGVMRGLGERERLSGIVNGIDDRRWAIPGLDYAASDLLKTVDKAKRERRRALFTAWGWKESGEPVIGVRGRWDLQKGMGLLVIALPKLLAHARLVLVTWGAPGLTPEMRELWDILTVLAAKSPDRIRLNPPELSTPDATAQHYTFADFFLLPSRYEPCGLVQMECQRYGAVPIVRNTGGLADTVSETPRTEFPSPNGFVFEEFHPKELVAAVARAAKTYHNATDYSRLQGNALAQRNGWDSRVPAYEALYRE